MARLRSEVTVSLPPDLIRALHDTGAHVEVDAPLAKRVWWRVGGPADALVEVQELGQLCAVRALAHAADAPVFVLGNGSNLLVADAGIRGIVVRLEGALTHSVDEGPRAPGEPAGVLRCGAGLKNNVLLGRAAKHRWAGLDPLAGIPGTIGGAVRMNAGSAMGEIKDILIDVELVLPDGRLVRLGLDELGMRYRHCDLPPNAIVATARLRYGAVPWEESEARVRAFLDKRKATQPLDQPSCGSTFRNPPGDAAGRLIEAAGLKGARIGGAEVSTKHANFLLNTGDATAADIRALIHHVMARVEAHAGVRLVPEVEIAGDWGA
jgi:UDP-N-acetylmuramate dehydrogenase